MNQKIKRHGRGRVSHPGPKKGSDEWLRRRGSKAYKIRKRLAEASFS